MDSNKELVYYIVDGVFDRLCNAYHFDVGTALFDAFVEGALVEFEKSKSAFKLVEFLATCAYDHYEVDIVEDDHLMLVDYVQDILDNRDDL